MRPLVEERREDRTYVSEFLMERWDTGEAGRASLRLKELGHGERTDFCETGVAMDVLCSS